MGNIRFSLILSLILIAVSLFSILTATNETQHVKELLINKLQSNMVSKIKTIQTKDSPVINLLQTEFRLFKKRLKNNKTQQNVLLGLGFQKEFKIEKLIKKGNNLTILIISLNKKKIPIVIKKLQNTTIAIAPKDDVLDNFYIKIKKSFLKIIVLNFLLILIFMLLIIITFTFLRKQNILLKSRNEELRLHDKLTGCFNKNFFYQTIDQEILRAQRYDIPLSLHIFDIDGLRMINEFFGFKGGSFVIKKTSNLVQKSIRLVDKLYYLGNGQFALLLPSTDQAGAFILGQRLRIEVGEMLETYNEKEVSVTISLGAGTLTSEDSSGSNFIKRVEDLMIKAKHSGRNRIC